jgi:hypothetical protein
MVEALRIEGRAEELMCRHPGLLERFRARWRPVRVKKTRQRKNPEDFRDSKKSENPLGCRGGMPFASFRM